MLNIPPDALARRQMLADHLKAAARKKRREKRPLDADQASHAASVPPQGEEPSSNSDQPTASDRA